MKSAVLFALAVVSTGVFADGKYGFVGSTTIEGIIVDAIDHAGLTNQVAYNLGGAANVGSGKGEEGIQKGLQGLAPMSREIKPEVVAEMKSRGINVITHKLGIDGLSILVNNSNPIPRLDLATLAQIYSCQITKWEQIQGSNMKGQINVFRRNDESGTTDAFKAFTGLKTIGACAVTVAESDDIKDKTIKDAYAIGYAGRSALVAKKNRAVPMAAKAGQTPVPPNDTTIRNFTYPMARYLFVYEVSGAKTPNALEKKLLSVLGDRSWLDPIMQKYDFVTLN